MPPLTVNPQSVPKELQQVPSWLIWVPTPNNDPNNPKILKRPVRGKDWQQQLLPFEDTRDRALSSPYRFGLGFAYTSDHPYICIDLDSQSEDNLALLALLDSFTEISPSGKGYHVIIKTDNKPGLVEVFSNGRRNGTHKRDLFIGVGFVTVTNNIPPLPDHPKPVRLIPASDLVTLLDPYFTKLATSQSKSKQPKQEQDDHTPRTRQAKAKKTASAAYVKTLLDKVPVKALTSDIFQRLTEGKDAELDLTREDEAREPWLIIGQALHNEYLGGLTGYRLWLNWSEKGNKFDVDALDSCWESFTTDGAAPITLGSLVALADAQCPDYADVDPKGKILGTFNNFNVFLRTNSIVLATNELTRQFVFEVPSKVQSQWGINSQGLGISELAAVINGELGKLNTAPGSKGFSHRSALSYIKTAANSTFVNPIKDYFQLCGEKWDGMSRLEHLMETITIPLPYRVFIPSYQRFIRKWLIQVMAAACHTKDNPARLSRVLILSGDQGIGKTMWVQSLFPKALRSYCIDKEIKLGKFKTESTKLAMELSTTLICNINEIDRVLKDSMASDFKAFLDQTVDNIVLPYGESPTEMLRRTVFIGSTNATSFLTDPSGNRRFELIHAAALNFNHSLDIEQLWGEVHTLYVKGEKWWLDVNDPLDAQAIADRDNINSKAFAFPHESFAGELDEIFDATRPISEWRNMTLKDVKVLVGFGNNTTNDKASRHIKTTLGAWLAQWGRNPLPTREYADNPKSRVFYLMPPLRETSAISNAFMIKEEAEHNAIQ